jgi:hypothetical protein
MFKTLFLISLLFTPHTGFTWGTDPQQACGTYNPKIITANSIIASRNNCMSTGVESRFMNPGFKCAYVWGTHKCVPADTLTGDALTSYNKEINEIIEARLKVKAQSMGAAKSNDIRTKYEKNITDTLGQYGKFMVAAAYAHAAYYCSDICTGLNITGTMTSTSNVQCYQQCATISRQAAQRMWEIIK